jgi:hypothetical protein
MIKIHLKGKKIKTSIKGHFYLFHNIVYYYYYYYYEIS